MPRLFAQMTPACEKSRFVGSTCTYWLACVASLLTASANTQSASLTPRLDHTLTQGQVTTQTHLSCFSVLGAAMCLSVHREEPIRDGLHNRRAGRTAHLEKPAMNVKNSFVDPNPRESHQYRGQLTDRSWGRRSSRGECSTDVEQYLQPVVFVRQNLNFQHEARAMAVEGCAVVQHGLVHAKDDLRSRYRQLLFSRK